MPTWAMWLACLGLLLERALIASSETALYLTSDMRAKQLSLDHGSAGARVLEQKTDREVTAAALRIGAVLSGFLAAAVGAVTPPRMLQLTRYGDWPWLSVLTPLAGALFVGFLAAMMDVIARSLVGTNPERWALRLSWHVSLLRFSLSPLMKLLVGVLNLVARPFGTRVRFDSPPPPLEELEKLLAAQAANTEGLDKSAPQLIRSIFELSDKSVRDVMVPRTEVISVEVTTPTEDLLALLAEENHSRLPVYKGDIDHIVGVLHARDLIPLSQHPDLIVVADAIRPAVFIPWLKPIGDLLREMQQRKIHMAMVVDEYGSFIGIVTLEDILREIVGDIGDEFEREEKLVEPQADGSFLVSAALEVADFQEEFGSPLPEGDFDTLGGFVSSLAGRLPEVGERFTFEGWEFVVHSKEGPRLDRIRLVRVPAADAGPPQPDKPEEPEPPKSELSGERGAAS
ncbi:MAG TPA: hemolysin family protein [Myxococcales bacterium]|nr:hemolysin family protein [Myxococcales bacterium]